MRLLFAWLPTALHIGENTSTVEENLDFWLDLSCLLFLNILLLLVSLLVLFWLFLSYGIKIAQSIGGN